MGSQSRTSSGMHWHPSRRLVVRLCGRMGAGGGAGVATIKSTGTRIQRTAERILRVYEPPVLLRAGPQVRTGPECRHHGKWLVLLQMVGR